MRSSHSFFRRWVFRPLFWLSAALIVGMTPGISGIWLVTLGIGLVFKFLALVAGVIWIRRHGTAFMDELKVFGPQLSLSEKMCRTDVWFAPFGVMDWRLFEIIEECEVSPSPLRRGVCAAIHYSRECCFSFESLLVIGTLVLALRFYAAYCPNQWLGTDDCLALADSLLMAGLIGAMAAEILVGHVLMGIGYSQHFHQWFHRPQPIGQTALLDDIVYFTRLVSYSLLSIAAICQSYFATFGGFSGILTTGYLGNVAASPGSRFSLFAEFFAFTCTTFATVGYGDVYPNTPPTRLMVAAIHLLTMCMVLVLLQVVLSQRNGGESDRPGGTTAAVETENS